MRYRVKTPLLAVNPDEDGRFRFITLSVGSIIDIAGQVQPSGVVQVRHEGRLLSVFQRDIEERSAPIEHHAANG